ncbi:MAG: DUF4055 domain-containing protein, partial [bacterium]|nr:DUF4055 domain-containing protein [bacterium]
MAVQDVTTADQAGVDTKSLGYKSMEGFWPMVEALESTEGMRAMASEFLPAEPKEDPDKYEARIQRSWLFPAYWNTVKEFSDAPYRTPVVIKDGEGMPEPLKLAEKDVDKEGRTLTQFMRSVLRAAIHYGVSHILPEFPAARPGLTLGEERKKNIRPYLTHVTAKDLRAWPLEVGPDGIERVRALRIHSETVEADGAYGETTVERIRVYNLAYPDQAAARATSHTVLSGQSLSVEEVAAMTGQPGTIEVHEKTKTEDGEAYVLREVIPYTYVGFPLVPLYTNRTGLLTGTPAMQELAETNVEHFQSESDQTNQLHFARVPIFSRTGITDEEKELGFAIGAGKSIDSNNADAKFAWVEHKGTAIASGRTHGLDIQDKMEALKAKA